MPRPDGRGGPIPASTIRAPPQYLTDPPCSPTTLSPTRQCPSPRSGWIPLGSLGELLQRLAQILHKRKNSQQVALPNLVIPSPAALAAPSAAISSPRSPLRGGDREERLCLGQSRAQSSGLGRGCCRTRCAGEMLPRSQPRSGGEMHTLEKTKFGAWCSGSAVGQAAKSHFLKEFVPEHTCVDVSGSTLKHLEFGGQSLFAAHETGITEPSTDTRDLQPLQNAGTGCWSHPGGRMAPRVTPELAQSRTWGIPESHLLQPRSVSISPRRKQG